MSTTRRVMPARNVRDTRAAGACVGNTCPPRSRGRVRPPSWATRAALLALCAAGVAGCIVDDAGQVGGDGKVARIGVEQRTPDEIQSQVMSFTDTYTALVTQGFDALVTEEDSLDQRRLIAGGRLAWVAAAVEIAALKNPVTAMLDMTVMVSLQREKWETYWRPRFFPGDNGAVMSEKLAELERDVWEMSSSVLDEQQQTALRTLIAELHDRYPNQIYVTTLRASAYAKERQASLLNIRGGGSLLRLFGLDPMANLSPATRQIAETRLLGERAFFYAKRLPNLVRLSVDDTVVRVVADPDIQRVIDAAELAGDASRRAAAVAEDVSVRLTEERTAAIDQVAARFQTEREAAFQQFFTGVASEREALLQQLGGEQEELRRTMGDLRDTAEVTNELSGSLERVLAEANLLTGSFERLKNPDARPFDVTEFDAAARTATEGVRELREAIAEARELLTTLGSDAPASGVNSVLAEGTNSANAVVDRLFERGVLLVAILAAALLAVLVAYRYIAVRVLTGRITT